MRKSITALGIVTLLFFAACRQEQPTTPAGEPARTEPRETQAPSQTPGAAPEQAPGEAPSGQQRP